MTEHSPHFCKIVATLGPASDAPDRILGLVRAGADAFRLNFSHGDHEAHAKRVQNLRRAEKLSGKYLPIIADLQGPKIRVGEVAGGEIQLKLGSNVTLRQAARSESQSEIPIPHKELFAALENGDQLLLDDGLLELEIENGNGEQRSAKILAPGILTNRKGVNIPGRRLPISALTEKDKQDMDFALSKGVDYVALSFVQTEEDLRTARERIDGRAGLITKIEKPTALDELEGIIAQSDAVMVARGDLGVELPLEQVPIIQRRIIRQARAQGKPVIVATQMLQSMIDSSTPTRAEASDTASAVYLGADAVMLSAESAIGHHPETAVAIMARIIAAVENDEGYWREINHKMDRPEPSGAAAIAISARHSAGLLQCKAILACTTSGSTALTVGRERPRAKIIGLTPKLSTARKINLAWGIRSVVVPDYQMFEELYEHSKEHALQAYNFDKGDKLILTAGIPMGKSGGTNVMKIMEV